MEHFKGMKNEIIIYQADDLSTRLEVRIEEETIWLTQAQIVDLFDSSKANISEHIKHIFQSGELEKKSTVRKIRTVQIEGNRTVSREITHYNLDMIISIGYRVNSIRGTQFRIWANKVLKDYLLKGYAVNQRMDRIENNVQILKEKVNEFDLQIKTSLPPNEGIFFDGQVFDAYVFVTGLIKIAKKSIILIDAYVDETVLSMLSKRKSGVQAIIFTSKPTKQLKLDLQKHNQQYPEIEMKTFTKSHDRFLIIDKTTVYHIGASLKDLGKKWFAFSKIDLDAEELIKKLNSDG
ncbi:MAG: RhuM family protein [Fidelibacterota bacterium]